MERCFLAGTGNAQEQIDTYYCYDDAGRLAGVLPPMLSAYLASASGTSFTLAGTAEVGAFAYLYRYDARGNMIAKRLPGAEWVYYIYDKGNRLVFTQDGNLRQDGKWMFDLTDRLGRPCLKGLCVKSINVFSNTLDEEVIEVTRSYPSLSTSDSYYGYSISGVPILQADILSVNWYGDYSFLGKWDIPSASATNSGTGFDTNAPSQGYGQIQSTLENGQLTGTMERILGNDGNNPYIWTVMYYDNRGRTVQQTRKNPMGNWDKTNTGYSYTGHPLLSRTVHYNGMKAFAERYSYGYDAWDRPLTVTHGLSSLVSLQTGEYTYGTSSQLHDYRYDFAGRQVLDNRNATNALKTSFGYNVRSWLTGIACGWNASTQSYGSTFLQTLRYQTVQSPSQNSPQWGGSIGSMDWKCGNDNVVRTYDFTYDNLSRLTGASYRDSQNGSGTYSRSYSYDKHGNILSVTSPSGTVSATYTGNRRAGSYTYDSNGNLTSDPDAGLSGMTYNALNLLSGYTETGSGYQTTIEYSASGEKTGVTTTGGNIISDVKHYYGNLIYDGITLWPTRLLIDGGYVDVTSRLNSISYAYRFYVQDHQGNNRMVTDGSGTVLQVNHYDPYGQLLTSISSTSPVSQYKYGGKEWNPTSLSYDFGARNYLPDVPRWNSMDPLAEKYYSISPYVYCAGNPVNLVDRDGKDFRKRRQMNTIVISANYYATGREAYNSAKQGVSFWNSRKEDSYQDPSSGRVYKIRYDLTVTEEYAQKEGAQHENTYSIDDSRVKIESKNGAVGVTLNKNSVYIKKSYALKRPDGKTSSTPAHEIGHTLGMSHKDKGVMSEAQDDNRTAEVPQSNIEEMMTSSVGFEEPIGLITRIYDWIKKHL